MRLVCRYAFLLPALKKRDQPRYVALKLKLMGDVVDRCDQYVTTNTTRTHDVTPTPMD